MSRGEGVRQPRDHLRPSASAFASASDSEAHVMGMLLLFFLQALTSGDYPKRLLEQPNSVKFPARTTSNRLNISMKFQEQYARARASRKNRHFPSSCSRSDRMPHENKGRASRPVADFIILTLSVGFVLKRWTKFKIWNAS